MADVNKIKLPDNTTVNIKDSRISGIDSTPTSGSNNIITSGGVYNSLGDYLPLSGGTMAGSLAWSSAAALPADTSPARFLVVDSFDSGGATKYSTAASVAERLGVNSRVRYTQFGSTSAGTHYLIQFNNTNAWRGMFTVKIYDSYHFDVIEISGYNYENQTGWYRPRARVITSSDRDTVPIIYGYTAAQELWVAIATHATSSGQARSVSVQCYNGNYLNIATNVTISLINGEENLPGTIQEKIGYSNVLYPTTGVTIDTNQTISGTKTFSSGELTISTETTGTPTLILRRGTATDSYTDWRIINNSGVLYFDNYTSNQWNSRFYFSGTTFKPYSNVVDGVSDLTLGTASFRWSNIYSVDGNFSGNISVGGNITTDGTLSASNIPTYYSGTTDPDVSLGNDGDIYLKISS